MYVRTNFKTKKALREAVKAQDPKVDLTVFQPGPFGGNEPRNGTVTLEGPHYPAAHTWYAQAELKDGKIVKVK